MLPLNGWHFQTDNVEQQVFSPHLLNGPDLTARLNLVWVQSAVLGWLWFWIMMSQNASGLLHRLSSVLLAMLRTLTVL